MKIYIKGLTSALLAAAVLFSFGCAEGGGADTVSADTTAADTQTADTTAADTEPAETEPTVKPDPPAGEHEKIIFTDSFLRLDFTASNGEELPYCLYVPSNYSDEYAYPLFLYLHGAGVRGDDNGMQVSESIQDLFLPKNTPIYDSIAVFPLCDEEGQWVDVNWDINSYSVDEIEISRNMVAVVELLDYIMEEYSINPNRQYVTGISMGGYGTWDLICRYPDRFAAAAPMCGGGDPSRGEVLKDLPIWVAHDTDDYIVSVEASLNMVNAIREAGGEKLIFQETKDYGHSPWKLTYRSAEFQEWMFSQVKE